MKKLLVLLLLSWGAAAQNTPVFPGAAVSNNDLTIASNLAQTTLSSTINNSVTTIPVGSTTGFTAPVLLWIDSEELKCLSKTSNTFTSCTRGFDNTSAGTHSGGVSVSNFISAYHVNQLDAEVIAIESKILGLLGDVTITGGANLAATVTKINGSSVATNAAADQLLRTTASATASWATIPDCDDSTGQHLNYDTTAHTFSCGTSTGSVSLVNGVAFPASPSTDTVPVVTASNTITYKSVPDCDDTGGQHLNYDTTTHAFSCGLSGGSGGGNVTHTNPLTAGQLVIGNGTVDITVGDLSGDATTSGSAVTTVVKVDGVAYPAAPSTDTVPVITASNTATYKAIPDCDDTSGNHLNYDTTTHAFSCGTSSSAGGGGTVTRIVTTSPITGGTITTTGTIACATCVTSASALTPNGSLLKASGGAQGITVGDLSGDVTTSGSLVTTVVKVNGVAYSSSPATNTTPVITVSGTATYTSIPSCNDSGGQHLNYNTSTHAFSCGTTGSGTADANAITTGTLSAERLPGRQFDIVKDGGADPTGVSSANAALAAAHDFFNSTTGGTITGCGIFNITTGPWIITNPGITVENNCGGLSSGWQASSPVQLGGLEFTSSSLVNVPDPTAAAELSASASGGTLAATTYYFTYTLVNGNGETLPAPVVSATTTGSTGSITFKYPQYKSGGWGYNLYMSTNAGATGCTGPTYTNCFKVPGANISGNGTLTGPPFLTGRGTSNNPVITAFTASGANPPGTNTATKGLTLIQVGTSAIGANSGTTFKGVTLHGNANISGGLVVVQAQRVLCDHCEFDSFTMTGSAPGGELATQLGAIAYTTMSSGSGSASTNHTEMRSGEFYNNTLSMSIIGDDDLIQGGDVNCRSGQVGIDMPNHGDRINDLHMAGNTCATYIYARGNTANSHFGAIVTGLKVEALASATGPGIKLFRMKNGIFELECSGGTTATQACVQIVDVNTKGNIIAIAPQLAQTTFSDGSTVGVDLGGDNTITIAGDSPMILATRLELHAIAAPSSPPTGTGDIYIDSTSLNMAVKNASGTVNHGVRTLAVVANTAVTGIADNGSLSTATFGNVTTSVTLTADANLCGNGTSDIKLCSAKVFFIDYKAGITQAGTPAIGMSFDSTANVPTATSIEGSNVILGEAAFANSAAVQDHFTLPTDWTGAIDIDIYWVAAATTGNVKWDVSTAGTASGGSIDPAFNSANTVTTTVSGTTNRLNVSSITGLTLTGLTADGVFWFKLARDATDTMSGTANLVSVRFKIRRTF